ncbi:MAG: tetratricopeptide repeat protein [Gemmatimonadota bacterium]|nr:tetratricopeptide repeat protein [Gemmatimonadota bacterium]
MRWIAGFLVVVVLLFAVVTLLKRGPRDAPEDTETSQISTEDRERVQQFWETYRQATDHRIAGRLGDAREAYTRALALNPGHQDALYYLGNMAFDLGNLPEAERAWRRLVEVDPSNARGHSQLGTLYSCVAAPTFLNLESAAAEFARALEINREETGPLLHLGEIALLRGDLELARSWFEKVTGSNYTSVEAHFYRGYLAWKAGALRRATELLAAAVGFARPAAPAEGVAGEGDTRAGRRPMVAEPAAGCRPMRVRVEDLRALDDTDLPRGMDSVYRALDGLLAHVQ